VTGSGHVRKLAPDRHDWRTTKADDREAVAATIADALERLADLEALHESEGDQDALHAGRAYAAYLRSRRNDCVEDAARLRSAAREEVA
jgi:hypothetical protein